MDVPSQILDAAGPLPGSPFGGRFDASANPPFYRLHLDAGQTFLSEMVADPGTTLYIWLYDSQGRQLAVSGVNGTGYPQYLGGTIVNSGTYYLSIGPVYNPSGVYVSGNFAVAYGIYNWSPVGNLDAVNFVSPQTVLAWGWAADPDYPNPINVQYFVDGTFVGQYLAAYARADVGPRGFAQTLSSNLFTPGTHNVCAYAINGTNSGGLNSFIGCKAVYIPSSPVGSFDGLMYGPGPGKLTLWGWALDPDTASSIQVHVYNNGSLATAPLNANQNRPDIAHFFPFYGASHGYQTTIPVTAEHNVICAYGINAPGTPGSNALLGCRVVNLAVSPIGALDSASRNGSSLTTSGWAIDPDTGNPIQVHIYVDGVFQEVVTAGNPRGDIGAAFPAYGANHGFSTTIPVTAARHTVCAYGINASGTPGNNVLLGCRITQ